MWGKGEGEGEEGRERRRERRGEGGEGSLIPSFIQNIIMAFLLLNQVASLIYPASVTSKVVLCYNEHTREIASIGRMYMYIINSVIHKVHQVYDSTLGRLATATLPRESPKNTLPPFPSHTTSLITDSFNRLDT